MYIDLGGELRKLFCLRDIYLVEMARTPSPRRRRSRSRERDRKRRRSRSRERRDVRDDRRDNKRPGERDYRRKSWSRSRSRSAEKQRLKPRDQAPKRNITAAELEGKSEEEQEMLKLMGFCGFTTTKNQKVDENDAGEVHVILKRKYRQYMNRKGGFNRPLDFVA